LQLSQEETYDPGSTSTTPSQPIERVITQPKKSESNENWFVRQKFKFLPLVITRVLQTIRRIESKLTESESNSNRIESNRVKLSQIESNRIESDRIKSN